MAPNSAAAAATSHHVFAASTLKGDRVRNFAGEDLGKIDEFAVDFDSGRIAFVIISIGGFLGIGDKLFAVPWELFSMRSGEQPSDVDRFFVDIDKQMLLDAPSFERSTWPDLGNPTWADRIRAHYAQKPYWNSDITEAGDYIGDDRLDKSDRDRL